MPKEPEVKDFNESSLSSDEKEAFDYAKTRIEKLHQSRKDHFGTDIDALFVDADKDSIPHRLRNSSKKVLAEDETKGWAGTSSMVQLGKNDWQSDVSKANPYIKLQTALAILVDQNPSGVFTATSKKYEKANILMKQLYERSWEYAKSKTQLKLFIYNLAKYGWAIARTYPLNLPKMGYDDIFRENLDPRNAWIDDMARPGNTLSLRDWTWRKVYPMDTFKEEFSKYENVKYVKAGGNIEETITGTTGERKETELVEVNFYENVIKDSFVVIANGVPVVIEKLPISNIKGLKKLSCWQTFWTLRHAESVYGIGIYEAAKYDNALLDRIRNMTIDQLTLSIYKMFFYQGTQALTETGDIIVSPGVGKQTLDPKNINWMQVPGPGAEAWQGIDMFQKDSDLSCGITDPLQGEVTGKTAFELAQAKESALKRLKSPLGNILDALNEEGYITVALIQLLYSVPEVYTITDPKVIEEYLKETKSDPELFSRTEDSMDEQGNMMPGEFKAKVFREFPLNLDKDEKGNLVDTKDTQFFRVKPSGLAWDGIINIKSQSLLSSSKQVDKAMDLEMYNMLIPLLVQPPELYSLVAKSICKLYDKDPADILPASWLEADKPKEEPLMVPQAQVMQDQVAQMTGMGGAQQGAPQQAPNAPTMVSRTQGASNPQSLIGKISAKVTQPFRA